MVLAGVMSMATAGGATASGPNAATGLKLTAESCSSGLAMYRLSWTPSGKGAQRVDLSATDNGFASGYASANLDAGASAIRLSLLKPGTTYHVRIVTATASGAAVSDTLSFEASCVSPPAFSVPANLHATAIGKDTLRFQWTRGQGNQYFCLDTATSLADLYNYKGSWRNHHCWTTSTSVDVSGVKCGTVVYWRVFAWGAGSGHSQPSVVVSQPCVTIGAPVNLHAQQIHKTSTLLFWTPGEKNDSFCVNLAKSAFDLAHQTGSWKSFNCGNPTSSAYVDNLECGVTYHWDVTARNAQTSIRSAPSTFKLTDCEKLVNAPIEGVAIEKHGDRHYAEVVAALPDACHKAAGHEVVRSGNTFHVKVLNSAVPGPCAFVHDTYVLNVNLGTDLVAGKTYKVIVNESVSKTFVAQ
jgi:hypothetical protein